MNASSYEAKFNFGLKRPWSFNIVAYESSKLPSTSFLSYDQFLLNRRTSMSHNGLVNWQLEEKQKQQHHHMQDDEYGDDDDNSVPPPIQEIIVAHLVDEDNSGSASNECSTSESEDTGSEKKGGFVQTCRRHNSHHHHHHRHNDQGSDENSMLPPPVNGFRTSPKSNIKKTPQHGKSSNQVNFSSSNVQYALEQSDSRGSRNGQADGYGPYYDDHDGEDSMAVELSSVDSIAVNDLRDCGISIGGDADSAMAINGGDSVSVMSTFTTPALTQNMQHHQQSDEMNGIGMEYNYALSASAAGVIDTTITSNTHGHYNTLADGNGALNWLQTASEANIQSRSFFALRSTDDGDSERSIATSLFVEVSMFCF